MVIDLTGQNADLAKQIADTIAGEVSSLPEGESKPTDSTIGLLVILGKNYISPNP